MVNSSILESKLCELVQHFAVPAALLSTEENSIVASNPLMVSSYGEVFSVDQLLTPTFTISGHDYLKFKQKDSQIILNKATQDDADFEVITLSDELAILIEAKHRITQTLKNRVKEFVTSSAPVGCYSPFSFSYMYSFSSGKWNCSSVDDLMKLNLLERGRDLSDFNWRSLIVEEDIERYDEAIAEARSNAGNYELNYCIEDLCGETIQVFDHCSHIKPEGQWPILVGSIVSSRESFEEIQHAERQVLVGRLVGGMIHDFKNLLTGIQNIIEWCITQSTDNDEVIDALHKTVSYTEQATGLISGALKVSSGEAEKRIEEINVGELVTDFEGLVRRILPASTKLIIEVEDDLPAIFGQRSMLQDLLLNLCVNAKDAMKEQGDSLTVQVCLDKNNGGSDFFQSHIILSIADTGCGMSKEALETIFEAFYSTKETGAGLGLWMVREAVKSFNGKIDVFSTIGEGTTFEITIPVNDGQYNDDEVYHAAEEEVLVLATESMVCSEGKQVLFIEDEPLIRSGVSAWLESWGIDLLTASDGIEGSNLFAENHKTIDLVIQDYILPGKRGDELLREFQELNSDVPVIVTSANPGPEQDEMVEHGGAYAFLEKPFRMDKLQAMLQQVFS